VSDPFKITGPAVVIEAVRPPRILFPRLRQSHRTLRTARPADPGAYPSAGASPLGDAGRALFEANPGALPGHHGAADGPRVLRDRRPVETIGGRSA